MIQQQTARTIIAGRKKERIDFRSSYPAGTY
jgi:hypothetical protein